MRCALEEGHDILDKGGRSLDAVERAVIRMEEVCAFDAGCGSFLNQEGEVEMDAMIMDGRDLSLGSVAAIRNVRHPIRVARQVMERTGHCLLVGQGATDFARSLGEEMVPSHQLVSPRELKRWKDIKKNGGYDQRSAFQGNGKGPSDTVGAVALDDDGNISVATSTGGTPSKMVGRVGDSPLVGCGSYADNDSAGVSSTGFGESLMKVCMARRVCEAVGNGRSVAEAARSSVEYLERRVGGLGGVIVLDRKGELSWYFNTPRMAVGCIDSSNRMMVDVINGPSYGPK